MHACGPPGGDASSAQRTTDGGRERLRARLLRSLHGSFSSNVWAALLDACGDPAQRQFRRGQAQKHDLDAIAVLLPAPKAANVAPTGTNSRAKVVLPAPFGPAITMQRGVCGIARAMVRSMRVYLGTALGGRVRLLPRRSSARAAVGCPPRRRRPPGCSPSGCRAACVAFSACAEGREVRAAGRLELARMGGPAPDLRARHGNVERVRCRHEDLEVDDAIPLGPDKARPPASASSRLSQPSALADQPAREGRLRAAVPGIRCFARHRLPHCKPLAQA